MSQFSIEQGKAMNGHPFHDYAEKASDMRRKCAPKTIWMCTEMCAETCTEKCAENDAEMCAENVRRKY